MDEKTLAVLEALCRKTLRAHGLGAGAHDALYDRMRGVLLSYVNGKVPVTPDEALLLVHQQFADAASIEDLRAIAPTPPRDTISLGRRLAVGFTMMLAVETGGKIVVIILMTLLVAAMRPASAQVPESAPGAFGAIELGIHEISRFLQPVVFAAILLQWRRRLDSDTRIRRIQQNSALLAGLALALVVAYALVPQVPNITVVTGASSSLQKLSLVAANVLWLVTWLWWCDQLSGNPKAITLTILAQVGWILILLATGLGSYFVLQFTPTQASASWHFFFVAPHFTHMRWILVMIITLEITSIIVASVLYGVAILVSRQRAA